MSTLFAGNAVLDGLERDLRPLLGRDLLPSEKLAMSQGIVPPQLALDVNRAIQRRLDERAIN